MQLSAKDISKDVRAVCCCIKCSHPLCLCFVLFSIEIVYSESENLIFLNGTLIYKIYVFPIILSFVNIWESPNKKLKEFWTTVRSNSFMYDLLKLPNQILVYLLKSLSTILANSKFSLCTL